MTGRIVTFAYTGPEALAAHVLRGLCDEHGVVAGADAQPVENLVTERDTWRERAATLEQDLLAMRWELTDQRDKSEAAAREAAERLTEAERQRDGWRAQHGEWRAEAERLAGRLAAITDEVNERRALTDRLVRECEALKARLAEAEALAAERVGRAETGDAPAPPEAAAPQPAPPRNAPALGNLVRVSTPLMTVTTRAGASFRVTSSLFCRALEVLADGQRAHLVTVARQAGFANGEALLNVARVNQKTLLRNGLALRVGGEKDSMIHLAEAS